MNLQCAFAFLIAPQGFAPSFELTGVVGESMIRGMGVLFVMWNIPYIFAFIHPVRYKTSLLEAMLMQFTGFAGESLIWLSLPLQHEIVRSSIFRFMVFDGAGFIVLVIAWIILSRQVVKPS
jgi:hypothetical protein